MPQLLPLRFQIPFVVRIGFHLDGHLLNNFQAVALQPDDFFRIVRQQPDGLQAEVNEDLREYGLGAQILVDLGLKTIRLLTNNPKKVVGLEGYGLKIVEQMPIRVKPNPHNERYLKVKREKMGHLL